MKKKNVFLITIFAICILCLSLSKTSYAATNKCKSFSLVVSGAGVGNGDKDEMIKIFQKNKLYSDNSVWQFTYDTEAGDISAGTTKASYNRAIDTAYKKCTANDTAYFFHSGHGMEGLNKGWGIMLKTAYGGSPFSWYKYDDLLEKLSSVSCKHMVVIIHACESGAVKEAYDKLSQSKKNKISLFWSSGVNEPSRKSDAFHVSVYGQTLIQLLGYDGKLYADTDNDGNVTVKELGDHINSYIKQVSEYVGARPQTPGYTSAKNLSTVIYSYNLNNNKNTTSIELNKHKATIYKECSVKLVASVKGKKKNIKWKSSNSSIASISSTGKVTGKKAGKATISASANGVKATCKITVKNPTIKLTKTKATLNISGKKAIRLSAKVKGKSSKIVWKSSKPSVADVDAKGKVTAKEAGKTTISAKANGKTAKCTITVVKKKSSNPKMATPSNGKYLYYSTSYPDFSLYRFDTVKGVTNKIKKLGYDISDISYYKGYVYFCADYSGEADWDSMHICRMKMDGSKFEDYGIGTEPVVYDEKIYFESSNGISQMTLNGKKIKLLVSGKWHYSDLKVIKGRIYYVETDKDKATDVICSYDLKSKKKKVISDTDGRGTVFDGKDLYFIEHIYVYKMDGHTQNVSKVMNVPYTYNNWSGESVSTAELLCASNGKIYYDTFKEYEDSGTLRFRSTLKIYDTLNKKSSTIREFSNGIHDYFVGKGKYRLIEYGLKSDTVPNTGIARITDKGAEFKNLNKYFLV